MNNITPLPSVRQATTNIGQLVEEICDQGKTTTTVLIACCSRSYFLNRLIEYTRPATPITPENPHPLTDDPADLESEDDPISVPQRQSQLLQPTLKLIAASSRVKLAFCPTIPTFRAYLSVLPSGTATGDKGSSRILILNVLALHRDTSEFTLQGLSRSFSLIASVNHLVRCGVELIECTDVDERVSTIASPNPWDTEVPLLSGSIKIGEAGQGWASRKISVKNFADRWFDFV